VTSFDLLEDDDLGDLPPERRLTTGEQKLQRWVDLLAALLIRHRHAPFDELAKDVPGYDLAHGQRESVLRTFERDKDELRRFGVPIDTVKDADGNTLGYRLERKAFYLPYLMLAGQERAARAPRKVEQEGYRSLETLAFEPDELDAIIEAATRVRALGDPILAGEAEAAIRKLALDLPLGAVLDDAVAGAAVLERSVRDAMRERPLASPAPAALAKRMQRIEPTIVPPRRLPDTTVFDRLSDALARRKAVTFDYYSMERGERSRRVVEPYGLFFVSAHWYLAGRDVGQDALRNFRLSRVSHVEVNSKKSQTPDYDLPPDFSLREHAKAREPWEIGDGDATPAIVEFVATTGATRAALELGRPVEGSDNRRRFDVRRLDAFARWLLSFGGDARPIDPPELRAEYERVASETLARYTGGRSSTGDQGSSS
jgi:predicted DNA-binding transcriptional regulator YafY